MVLVSCLEKHSLPVLYLHQFHLDVEFGDWSRFHDILQCYNVFQGVIGPNDILGHTLGILISPCDFNFVQNVSDVDFISGHAVFRCKLDFSCS